MDYSLLLKIIPFIIKLAIRSIEKNEKIKRILHKFDLIELKTDFDSIYCRALVEYGVEKYPPQFCRLFGEKEVINAFRDELYENNNAISLSFFLWQTKCYPY